MMRRSSVLSVDVNAPPAGDGWNLDSPSHRTSAVATTPKSPVQRRLEKRARSPAGTPIAFALDNCTNLAKKRRERLIQRKVEGNARRVARAKAVARAQSMRAREAARALADEIAQRQRAAADRRAALLAAVCARASARPTDGPPQVQRSADAALRLALASQRRKDELERRAEAQRQHLERVRLRCRDVRGARALQKWWRSSQRSRRASKALLAPGGLEASLATVLGFGNHKSEISFEAVAAHLSTPAVLHAAQKLLTLLRGGRGGQASPALARGLLSAVMIEQHPQTVLGDNPDSGVERAARRLLRVMRMLLSALQSVPLSRSRVTARTSLVRAAHLGFAKLLADWKSADARAVADELLAAHAAISAQRARLLRHAERDAAAGRAEDPGLAQHLQGTHQQLESLRARAAQLLRGQALARWEQAAHEHVSNLALDEDSVEEEAVETEPLRDEALPKARVAPSNEQMVHELLLDPEYRLVSSPTQDALDAAAQRAMAQQLAARDGRLLAAVVADVRDRLAALTPRRSDLAAELSERLDDELLAQQAAAGALGGAELHALVHFMGERLIALQAPARTEGTRAWLAELAGESASAAKEWTQLAPQALSHVLRELSVLELDMANFKLRALGQQMRQSEAGVAYLRSAFTQRVTAGEYARGRLLRSAPRATEDWIVAALEAVRDGGGAAAQPLTPPPSPRMGPIAAAAAAAAASSPDALLAPASEAEAPPDVTTCVIEGLLHYLLDEDAQLPLPETLRERDGERLAAARDEAQALCRLGVADLAVSQAARIAAGSSTSTMPSPEALRRHQALLLGLVRSELTQLGAQAAPPLLALAKDLARAHGAQKMPDHAARALEALLGQGALRNTVARQLGKVLRNLLRDAARAGTCAHALKKVSLSPWEREVETLAADLRKVLSLNVAVHGVLYEDIRRAWSNT